MLVESLIKETVELQGFRVVGFFMSDLREVDSPFCKFGKVCRKNRE